VSCLIEPQDNAVTSASPRFNQESFRQLVAAVQACRLCPSMEGRRRVLSEANGGPDARVIFIAEAPGRRGGEVTGIPLSRDASGQRFSRLLGLAGLRRDEVFITNAVLCNPRTEAGMNRPPVRQELARCAGWLEAQLEIVPAPVAVTLGAVALAALDRIERHGLVLRRDAGRAVTWRGRTLVPLYHPSPRAGLSRSYAGQDEDFRRLGALVRQLPGTSVGHNMIVNSVTNE
jgi:uracil-DNA glycosylase family 4